MSDNMEPRVFIDMSDNNKADRAVGCGYYVRLPDLRYAIDRIEGLTDSKVIGIIYTEENTAELLLDPPLGDEDE